MNNATDTELVEAIGRDILIPLAQELTSARRKYLVFATEHNEAADLVESEMHEWKSQAMLVVRPDGTINTKRRDKAVCEGFQVISTMIRYLRKEWADF